MGILAVAACMTTEGRLYHIHAKGRHILSCAPVCSCCLASACCLAACQVRDRVLHNMHVFQPHMLTTQSEAPAKQTYFGLLTDSLLCSAGSQLPEHQGAPGPDMPNSCQHDQGQDTRGDPKNLQHQGKAGAADLGCLEYPNCILAKGAWQRAVAAVHMFGGNELLSSYSGTGTR